MQRLPSSIAGILAVAALFCAAACGPSAPAPAAPAEAHRIVSLAPAFTETLIALGATDRVVAIGRYDPQIAGRPRLGDAMGVDLESLTALEPDLVLVNAKVLSEKLAPVAGRIPVVELPTDRLDEALVAIAEIARRTGRVREGEVLLATIRSSLTAAESRAAERRANGAKPPRVLVVVQRRPFYSAGRGSFVDELLTIAGAENAFGDLDKAWPSVNEEAIVARAPEVILDASVGDVDTDAGRAELLADWSRFPTIPAVRDGRVRVIREDSIFRAGPRIPEAIAVLERLLYGEGK